MSASVTALVVGLPGAGKTTFLAALWHALNTPNSESSLQLTRLESQREYVNRMAEAWRKCEPVPRTSAATEQIVRLKVALVDRPEAEIELIFPDHAGEKFAQQWETRLWDAAYATTASLCNCLIIFINPETHVVSPTIADATIIVATLEVGEESDGEAVSPPWDMKLAPSDVQLTDVTQFIFAARRDTDRLAVAVVVSAWDLVAGRGLTPQEWLRAESPLLSQFLDASVPRHRLGFFGVSAQGGDFAREAEHLCSLPRPSDRVAVVAGEVRSRDIAHPVCWLLRTSLL